MERHEGEHRVATVMIVEELICPIMRDVGSCDGVKYSNSVVWEESLEHADLTSQPLIRSWGFFLPTSISSSPFNSSISIHVILKLDPPSTLQLSHGSRPDFLHKLKGSYDIRRLFRGIFWSMGHQCLRYQIRTVASVGGCS